MSLLPEVLYKGTSKTLELYKIIEKYNYFFLLDEYSFEHNFQHFLGKNILGIPYSYTYSLCKILKVEGLKYDMSKEQIIELLINKMIDKLQKVHCELGWTLLEYYLILSNYSKDIKTPILRKTLLTVPLNKERTAQYRELINKIAELFPKFLTATIDGDEQQVYIKRIKS